jgi:glutathione S-transferase
MLTLFQRETCPYCKPVRELLTELGVSYLIVNVPKPRDERHELIEATGSKFIPALVDGGTIVAGVLEDNSAVLAYLRHRFGHQPESPAVSPAAEPLPAAADGDHPGPGK